MELSGNFALSGEWSAWLSPLCRMWDVHPSSPAPLLFSMCSWSCLFSFVLVHWRSLLLISFGWPTSKPISSAQPIGSAQPISSAELIQLSTYPSLPVSLVFNALGVAVRHPNGPYDWCRITSATHSIHKLEQFLNAKPNSNSTKHRLCTSDGFVCPKIVGFWQHSSTNSNSVTPLAEVFNWRIGFSNSGRWLHLLCCTCLAVMLDHISERTNTSWLFILRDWPGYAPFLFALQIYSSLRCQF